MKDALTTDYKAVYKAWLVFRKGKKSSHAIDEFAYYLEDNITRISAELTDKTYKHGSYQKVIVHEKKRRDLVVAGVRDRVVHRLIYDYLVEIFDKQFDADVWSCRKCKGLHKCLARTQKLLKKYSNSYVWRADITKFFDSVNQGKLFNVLDCRLDNNENLIWICREVINSYTSYKQTNKQTNKQGILRAREKSSPSDRFIRCMAR